MNAGYRMQDGGRIDVVSKKETRRIEIEVNVSDITCDFTLTVSEARAVASALMGAAAEV